MLLPKPEFAVFSTQDLAAGHAHSSDRYRYLRELAFEYAFLLEKLELGAVDSTPMQRGTK